MFTECPWSYGKNPFNKVCANTADDTHTHTPQWSHGNAIVTLTEAPLLDSGYCPPSTASQSLQDNRDGIGILQRAVSKMWPVMANLLSHQGEPAPGGEKNCISPMLTRACMCMCVCIWTLSRSECVCCGEIRMQGYHTHPRLRH